MDRWALQSPPTALHLATTKLLLGAMVPTVAAQADSYQMVAGIMIATIIGSYQLCHRVSGVTLSFFATNKPYALS